MKNPAFHPRDLQIQIRCSREKILDFLELNRRQVLESILLQLFFHPPMKVFILEEDLAVILNFLQFSEHSA